MKNKSDFIFTLPQTISNLYDLKNDQEFEINFTEKDAKYLIIKLMTNLE